MTDLAQHDAGCTFNERTDEPGVGYGLAGGGIGPYSYCPVCFVILHKTQERDLDPDRLREDRDERRRLEREP